MTRDATDRRRSSDGEQTVGRAPEFATAAALLGLSVVAAASAGVLSAVGPYLLAISVLVGALFALGRR